MVTYMSLNLFLKINVGLIHNEELELINVAYQIFLHLDWLDACKKCL